MCNFNKQDDKTKALLHQLLNSSAHSLGGHNFLLGLVESIKNARPSALTTSKCEVKSDNASIKWNKIIFQDKVTAFEEVLLIYKDSQNYDSNFLDIKNDKKKKRVINMLKTLAPIEFIAKPKNEINGEGFTFNIFTKIDFENNIATVNPIFMALFFCSVEFTKKALKFEEK